MATAVTASDCIVRGFKFPIWHPIGLIMGLALGFTKPRQPILGIVLAGEIESTGKAVKSLGANKVIDYTKEDFPNRGESYDFIFDAVGKKKSSKFKLQCKKALTRYGIYTSDDDRDPGAHIEDLILLKELVEAGKIKAVIDRCYPLEPIVEAHRYVDKGHKKENVVIILEHNNKT